VSVLFQGSSAPAVVLEAPLPGITAYRTHVPVKITNVQLGTLQTLGPMPANGGEDSLAHDVLLKGNDSMHVSYDAETCYDAAENKDMPRHC